MKPSLSIKLGMGVLLLAATPLLANAQTNGYQHDSQHMQSAPMQSAPIQSSPIQSAPMQDGQMGRDRHDDGALDHRGMEAGHELDARIDHLKDRLDRGYRTGALSRREVRHLTSQLNQIIATKDRLETRNHGHLDPRTIDILNVKLDNLSAAIHFESDDGDHHDRH